MTNQTAFHLTNKTIVITGASSGIGQACAVRCSEMGAKIIAIGRDEERLKSTIAQLNQEIIHHAICVDLTVYDEVEYKLKKVLAEVGDIHGVINAAGISPSIPFRMMSIDKIEHAFKTNVTAGLYLTKLLCKPSVISSEGASIIFIASVMGEVGEVGKSLYGMTKGALIAGVKSLAIEYAKKKIRFNAISPGVVVSPMSMNSVYANDPEALKKIQSYHPLALGEPDDIANACIYLLSDASKWVTGSNITIDGGYSAR